MDLKRIIISRTDSIGDVILSLPMAGVLKQNFPDLTILFLGKNYTRAIVESSKHIDQFVDWDEIQKLDHSTQVDRFKALDADAIVHVFPVSEIAHLAKKAKIPLRIGTTGRLYHYFTCNKLVPISRKKSELHEAELNLKLLNPILKDVDIELDRIEKFYGFTEVDPLPDQFQKLISKDKNNIILHPKSKGSAREWGLKNFGSLIEILPKDKFRIFITGTEEEGKLLKEEIFDKYPDVVDMTGKLTLKELVSFINASNGLIAASTGPLHIAAALGKVALGIYPPIRPMHPGRWAPIGPKASYVVENGECSKCRNENTCECMENIQPVAVKNKLLSLMHG